MTFSARFKRSLTLWLGLALVLSFWIVAPFLDANTQIEWIRVLMIGYTGAAMVALFPAFRSIILEDAPIPAQQNILGTFLLLVGLNVGATWLLMWRMAGLPTWMVLSAVNGFLLWVNVVGAVFLVAAVRRDAKEPTNWRRVIVAGVLSLALGYLIVHERPDISPIVEWLRVRLSDLRSLPSHSAVPKWLEQTARASTGQP